MPSTAVFRAQQALVQAANAWDDFRVTLMLDEARHQARFSITCYAKLEPFERLQALHLDVYSRDFAPDGITVSRHRPAPDIIAHLILRGVISTPADVIVVTLALTSPGFFNSRTSFSQSSKETSRERHAVFQSLCQATTLTIYLPTHAIDTSQWQSLQKVIQFSRAGEPTVTSSYLRQQWAQGINRSVIGGSTAGRKRFRVSSTTPESLPQAKRRAGGGTPQRSPPPSSRSASPSSRTHVSSPEQLESLSRSRSPTFGQVTAQTVEDSRTAETLTDPMREEMIKKLDPFVTKLVDSLVKKLPEFLSQNTEPMMDAQKLRSMERVVIASTLAESALGEWADDAQVRLKEARDGCLRDIERARQNSVAHLEQVAKGLVKDVKEAAADAVRRRPGEAVGDAVLLRRITELERDVTRLEQERDQTLQRRPLRRASSI